MGVATDKWLGEGALYQGGGFKVWNMATYFYFLDQMVLHYFAFINSAEIGLPKSRFPLGV